jgi:hypothetical protein
MVAQSCVNWVHQRYWPVAVVALWCLSPLLIIEARSQTPHCKVQFSVPNSFRPSAGFAFALTRCRLRMRRRQSCMVVGAVSARLPQGVLTAVRVCLKGYLAGHCPHC